MTKKFVKKNAARPVRAPQARTRSSHNKWELVDLESLSLDGGTQSRVQFDADALDEYAGRMTCEGRTGLVLDPDGEPWPALVIFDDGKKQWLADGFHRVRAARKLGLTRFQADIKRGELRDAIRLSLSVNAKHGLRRTNLDKRLAITRALQDQEWCKFSDRKLAELCAVSAPTVSKLRKELEDDGQIDAATERIGQDGRVQDTSTRARATSKPRVKKKSSWRQLDVDGFANQQLAGLFETIPVAASHLDSIERGEPRGLVVLSSSDRTDIDATLDHLDSLLETNGTLVLPMIGLDQIPNILTKLSKRPGQAHTVVLEKSRGVAIVHTNQGGVEVPSWTRGLGSLLEKLGAHDAHIIHPSKS